MMDRLPVRSLTFDLRARAGSTLPGFLGPLLRSALGAALAQAAREGDAGGGEGSGDDALEAFRALFSESKRGHADSPRPWRLVAPTLHLGATGRPEATRLRAGSPLTFGVSLFGAAEAHGPALCEAVERLAWRGLGPARAPFDLAGVTDTTGRDEQDVRQRGPATGKGDKSTLTMRAATPLRLARRRGDPEEPSVGSVAGAAAERLRRLVNASGGGDTPAEPFSTTGARPPDTRAERLKARASFARVRLGRWSSRQGRWYPLDGHMGEAHVEQAPVEIAEALRAAAMLGVGKGTTNGLGRVVLEELP